jgi:tRNA modification GTPase
VGAPRDTIAALATPPGRGGIGVIRVSGPLAATIAREILGELPRPRRAVLRPFRDADGHPLDTGLALYFAAPTSFTGEDVLELHGHGGPVVMDMLLARALQLGARMAEAGEFSRRAFLNDKLDLTQAEAIADLIDSGSVEAARGGVGSV